MKNTIIIHYGTEAVTLCEPVKIKHTIEEWYSDVEYFVSTKEIDNKNIILFYYTLPEAIDDEEMSFMEVILKITYNAIIINSI